MNVRIAYSMKIFPRRRMWLALTGIVVCAMLFFGILSVVYWLSFSSSAYFGEADDIYVLASNGSATVKQSQIPLALAPALVALPGIEVVSPELFIYGILQDKAVIIRGILPGDFPRLESLTMVEGRWLRDQDLKGAVVGVNLAEKLDLHVNDTYVLSGSEVDDFITIRILGIYRGNGMIDDDLLLNMKYARYLQTETPDGYASIIRARVNTTTWPDVQSVWRAVSRAPEVGSLGYLPETPNNTERITVTCRATSLNQIGSVVLNYVKQGTEILGQKTMNAVAPDTYEVQIGPVKDTPWIQFWAKATDVLGRSTENEPINISITDALGPDIYDLNIEPPPPQTKEHSINVTFKVSDTSELIRDLTVHTYNAGRNKSYAVDDGPGGFYEEELGRFDPGELIVWVTAEDRFGNPGRTGHHRYRILDKTDQAPPDISEISYEPRPAYDNSTVNLSVRILDDSNITVANLLYSFQRKGDHFNGTLALNRSTELEDFWTAVTGPFPGSTHVHFVIYAKDEFGNARYGKTEDILVRYSVPPEILDVYRFPSYSKPGVRNLLFLNLYDASEISSVNISILDRDRWRNLTIPVNVTTYREPLYLGQVSPGVKEYSVTMIDRRGEPSRTPVEGMHSFLVDSRAPEIELLAYLDETPTGRPVKLTLLADSSFPLGYMYVTDSRGVIDDFVLSGDEYVAILGEYWKPGDYTFRVHLQDLAGNYYVSSAMPLRVLEDPVTDVALSPEAALVGETVTATCRIRGDSAQNEVVLWGQFGGTYASVPMVLEGGIRRATVTVEDTGVIPYFVEARIDGEIFRSKPQRFAAGSAGPSLSVKHTPEYPTSSEGLVIRIAARDQQDLRIVYIDLENGTEPARFRKVWVPDGPDFEVDFDPGVQLGALRYRVTAIGAGANTTYPPSAGEWIEVDVARDVFDPPRIEYQWLSPQSYVGFDGRRADDLLVRVDAMIRDEEGIQQAAIEYEVGGRSFTEPLLAEASYRLLYSAYLGPFDVNETIRARITATDIAGLTTQTPYFQYVLRDRTPPEISDIYHDPFEPTPNAEVTVGAEVTDDSTVKDVYLVVNGTAGEFREIMERYGNTYTRKIFAPAAGQAVSYRIEASDGYGNSNASETYTIRVRDENPPEFLDVRHEPEKPSDTEIVYITVWVRDREDAIRNVTLHWYQYEWMSKTEIFERSDVYTTFTLNASEFDPGTDVRYWVEAFDISGNKAVFPTLEAPGLAREAPPQGLGALAQEALEPYLRFSVVDNSPPTVSLIAYPISPNELQTVTFEVGARDNHLIKNLTLHLLVDGEYEGFSYEVGRPAFDTEFDSGALRAGGQIEYYLEAFDRSGNHARYPESSNLTISVRRLEYGGQIAVRDPRINVEVAGPAGFSEDMARQGAGKIITSINGILFMTFLATIAGIGNIVYTSIYRSKREIGIVRTLGGSKKHLTLLVAILTILVGFLAGLLGVGLAYLLITTLSNLGATLAWVTLKPTLNALILAATIAASVGISVFGGMVALSRLFSYTPVESIKSVVTPPAREPLPSYLDRTMHFPGRTLAVLLLILILSAAAIRLYPTRVSREPFDPDAWLHLTVARDMQEAGHIPLNYESRELQAVAALPGLNLILLFTQRLTGTDIMAGRILTPLVSSLGLLFAFVVGRRVSGSALVGAIAVFILAFAGYYSNRTAALTKEALALQILLFAVYLLYTGRSLQSRKFKAGLFAASVALMLTHHLTAIYLVLAFSGYTALVHLQKYSKGILDVKEAKEDLVLAAAIYLSFMAITFTVARYETQIPLQDALLILSLFFVCMGFGRLLLSSSFMDRHRRPITVFLVGFMVGFPIVAYRAGLFAWAPWEQVVPMLGPHLAILALAVVAIFPLSIVSEDQKAFLLAWASTVLPFLLFGIVKRDILGYILLFRNISYGYQLAALLVGITFVYFFKRYEWGRASRLRNLVVVVLAILLACNVGLASYMGFLSQDYERKDLYYPREVRAALLANASTLRGQLVGADERARRLLLFVTGEDGDQLTTYVYLIRMEKYLINRLRDKFEMTDRPLTHVFTYEDMYRVGFVDTVLFEDIQRPTLNRFEDVILDSGDNKLIYLARKEWP